MKYGRPTIGAPLVAVLLVMTAGVALASGETEDRPTTVLRGVVSVVISPDIVVLEDGTVVELATGFIRRPTGPLRRPSPGDEVVVVGRPGFDGVSITAGAVRVIRKDRGHRVPDGNVVCRGGIPGDRSGALLMGGMMETLRPKSGWLPAKTRDDEAELEGVVTGLYSGGFEMRDEDEGLFDVEVTGETEFVGAESHSDIGEGDRVKVKGTLESRVVTASVVERKDPGGDDDDDGEEDDDDASQGDGEDDDDGDDDDDASQGDGDDDDDASQGDGVEFEATGRLTELLPPDRFAMDDDRVYRVDADTAFDGDLISYAGLKSGQFLEVKATYLGGADYLAVKVELEGEDDDGQGYRKLVGAVDQIDETGLELTGGDRVLFTPSTEFSGDSDRAGDIQPGWWVEIEALENTAGDLLALEIRSDDGVTATIGGHDFEPHQALVIVVDGVDPRVVAERHAGEVLGTIGSMVALIHWTDEIDDSLLVRLDGDSDVAAVEPNYLFRDPESVRRRYPVVDRSPRVEKFKVQRAVAQTNLEAAVAIADGGGTVIAALDSGVDPCQPLLRGHLMAGGLDLVDGDLKPWEIRNGIDEDDDGDLDEAFGHGTFVATILALAAPGARILPYRVLDSDGGGTAFNIALALADAIERRVDVINLSLTYHQPSMVVDLLLEEASDRGIVVVGAAGNDGEGRLPFPASDGHVLAVGAMNSDGLDLTAFSNWNDGVILAAPGEDVFGGLAYGQFGTASGTSVAAPFAAAGAALVKSLDPAVSADIVRRLMVDSGTPVSGSVNALDLEEAVSRVTPNP